jgi:Ca2+-binding EF-hand superfamily protein
MDAARILYGRADLNNDRMVDLEEFVSLFKQVHPRAETTGWAPSEWKGLFNSYDKNGDGIVTWTEFYAISKFRNELKP